MANRRQAGKDGGKGGEAKAIGGQEGGMQARMAAKARQCVRVVSYAVSAWCVVCGKRVCV
jgi:hypothetical protein